MNARDVQNDLMSRRPKDKSLDQLVEAIKSGAVDNKKMIEVMNALVLAISKKPEIEIPAPKVDINFDVAALAQALGAMKQEIKAPDVKVAAPVIDLKPDINVPEPEPVAYEFTFKYGPNGRPVSATATPIRG